MKKETFFQRISVCSLLLMALFFACIFLQTGCNNSGAQPVSRRSGTNGSENWITVHITFMPKTNGEQRDWSIRAIEKTLIKSVAPYTNKYANYYPSIRITKMPFLDSMKCQISVINTFYEKNSLGEPRLLSRDTTIHPPPCPPCPGLCPECNALYEMYVGPNKPYRIANIVIEK